MANTRPKPSVAHATQEQAGTKRFVILDEIESENGHLEIPKFTLETAAGSVPALDPPRDAVEASRIAKAEKAERTIREMRRG